jgi:hypothetical protein
VGHAGGAEHVPAGAVDGALVAGDQRGEHAGLGAVGHAREHGVAHGFAGALDGVAPRGCKQCGRHVARAGAHVAAGMQALLPHPEFAVEAVRVAVAVRRPEAHGEAPSLAGMRHGREVVGVPAERDAPGHDGRRGGGVVRAGPARGFDVEAKPHSALVALGHLGHHAGDLQVAPFERRRQRALRIDDGAPSREPRARHCAAHERHHHQRARRQSPPCKAEHRKQQAGIDPRRPQRRLLQLQGRARQRTTERCERPRSPACRARNGVNPSLPSP